VIRTTLEDELKIATKAQDKRRTSTLRLILAALKDRDIDARGNGRPALGDDEIFGLLAKMIKQRQESEKIYADAGRADLATQEHEEIAIITGFLPKQLDAAETKAAVAAAIKEVDCKSAKDIGKVMALLKERFGGKMDFAKASALVKEALH